MYITFTNLGLSPSDKRKLKNIQDNSLTELACKLCWNCEIQLGCSGLLVIMLQL